MSDLFVKKAKQAGSLVRKNQDTETKTGGTTDAAAEVEKALGKVKIASGAKWVEYSVAGKTVKYVRDNLKAILTIDAGAQAVLDGSPLESSVEGNTVLRENQILEFVKVAGSKGVSH
jgi:hypothetical protein